MEKIAIGLGTNLGNRMKNIEAAYNRINDIYGLEIIKMSRVFETKPIGKIHQPDYYNAVLIAKTILTPEFLLNKFLSIEASLGRHRNGTKWGPRIIDIDLLIYGKKFTISNDIVFPHPEMHKRKFVLVPLLECWADWRHPLNNLTPLQMLEKLNGRDEPIPL